MEGMKHRTLCKICLEDFRATTMGGIVGLIVSIATLNPICLAGSLFGGLLLDATTCDKCRSEEDLHQIVMADRDEKGWFHVQTEAEPATEDLDGLELSLEHDIDASLDFDMDADF